MLWINQQCRVTYNLGQAGDVGYDHRRPAGHRLQRRQPEALIEGRVHQTLCGIIKMVQVVRANTTHEKAIGLKVEMIHQRVDVVTQPAGSAGKDQGGAQLVVVA